MTIAIIGYGKMGQQVEQLATERGHHIVLKIDAHNKDHLQTPQHLQKADVAIEFSTPETAYDNFMACFAAGLPVVSGTTGWLQRYDELAEYCRENGHAFFYASNFSLGVNLFFELNRQLAKLMNRFPQYDVSIEETHHIHKVDAPSGTAISLANDLTAILERKNQWAKDTAANQEEIAVRSVREGEIPGIHTVSYRSEMDSISIEHSANSRRGFALGAVLAAEWIKDKKGVFAMKDLLHL